MVLHASPCILRKFEKRAWWKWGWVWVKLGSNDLGPTMKMTQDEMLCAMYIETYKNYEHKGDHKLFKRLKYYLTRLEPY